MSKVLLLGLDGATFDYINPWLKTGKLPNIAKIIKSGSHGTLQSTYLPITATAWPSMLTGKNAGKHGLFDFRYRTQNSYQLLPSNLLGIGGNPLHLQLSQRGLKVGMINVPMTYPPREVNGVLISGFTTPENTDNWCFPAQLAADLENINKPYPFGILHDLMRIEKQRRVLNNIDQFIKGWEEFIVAQTNVVTHLLEKDTYDFFMLVFSNTDHINHYTPNLDHILKIYQQVDIAIGHIVNAVDNDTIIIIASDHGSAPLKKFIVLNRLLTDWGLIHFKQEVAPHFIDHLTKKIAWRYREQAVGMWKSIPKSFRRLISSPLLWKDPRLKYDYQNIDWSATKAYAISGAGNLYINLKDREPFGIVEPGKEYKSLREQIVQALLKLQDPETGQLLFGHARLGEEVYHGEYMTHAPDIVFQPKEETCRTITGFANDPLVRPSIRRDGTSSEYGYHTQNGILIATGPGIRQGAQISASSILDIAPTILHLMDQTVPTDIDGKVIEELFIQSTPVKYVHENPENIKNQPYPLSQSELEDMEERLRGLGYLD